LIGSRAARKESGCIVFCAFRYALAAPGVPRSGSSPAPTPARQGPQGARGARDLRPTSSHAPPLQLSVFPQNFAKNPRIPHFFSIVHFFHEFRSISALPAGSGLDFLFARRNSQCAFCTGTGSLSCPCGYLGTAGNSGHVSLGLVGRSWGRGSGYWLSGRDNTCT